VGDGKSFYWNAKGAGGGVAMGALPEADDVLHVRIPLQKRDNDLD
jgi:hypothetical protein